MRPQLSLTAGLFLSALLLAAPLRAQARTYTLAPGAPNAVVFSVDDNVDPFDGRTTNVTGTVVADPQAPSQASVEVSVDLPSLDTGNNLRNQHLREKYLQTDRFPKATFKSVSVVAPPSISPNQPADLTVTGDFSVHGITKRLTLPVKTTLLADGRIHILSNFQIRLPDFGISVPHNLIVTVDDAISIRLDLYAKGK